MKEQSSAFLEKARSFLAKAEHLLDALDKACPWQGTGGGGRSLSDARQGKPETRRRVHRARAVAPAIDPYRYVRRRGARVYPSLDRGGRAGDRHAPPRLVRPRLPGTKQARLAASTTRHCHIRRVISRASALVSACAFAIKVELVMPDLDQIKQGEQAARYGRERFAKRRSGNPAGRTAAGATSIALPGLCLPARLTPPLLILAFAVNEDNSSNRAVRGVT